MASQCLEELELEDYQIHLGNLGILRGILSQDNVASDHQDEIMALIDKGDADQLEKLLGELKEYPAGINWYAGTPGNNRESRKYN